MSDNRSTRSDSLALDAGTEVRQEEVSYDSILDDGVPGSTATAGGPSQEQLENPFHQLPEGSDEQDEEQVPERRFPYGITIAFSDYQSLLPGDRCVNLMTPASTANLTLQEWTEKIKEEGGRSEIGSPISMENEIHTMLSPANQERQNAIIATVRRDLERAYDTATAGGPSQQELENPFRQPPEGSDDDENEEQVPEREFPDGITFAISGYQSLMPGNPRLHLRTPASRSNLTLQEWTEKLEEEGGINWRDGSSRSLEFGIVTMLYPANQERQNTIIAIVRRDLERAYEDGTDFFDHTSEDPDSTQS
ncbi:hypothetical protein L202_08448 [Cryptococcus amylolentus CBS 6039]|uniref:Uncharacterized protein n=1 Tax=Cryptococcus amylolentus CBS 6039 TaxID=1295533 RepID=A0A1E3H9Q9_9TREE|nr:hypothetical protein L202_08448 [Cryptococcus amylolentus CBS 6039]ODN73053.1 hypothetical protein L202_08448 [Cryptococcus amylolentus CBS 6039]